jgi:hypothetical protein
MYLHLFNLEHVVASSWFVSWTWVLVEDIKDLCHPKLVRIQLFCFFKDIHSCSEPLEREGTNWEEKKRLVAVFFTRESSAQIQEQNDYYYADWLPAEKNTWGTNELTDQEFNPKPQPHQILIPNSKCQKVFPNELSLSLSLNPKISLPTYLSTLMEKTKPIFPSTAPTWCLL